jgi:hypothetical protein
MIVVVLGICVAVGVLVVAVVSGDCVGWALGGCCLSALMYL